ncbi:hypothetical protein [Variovorax sp. KK3]|uniref:hypothetical protein n=1 Tax=Variovorax sp. KK3 TaxID=1855728 RepID=UPI00097BE8CF|nr:hypothetical protein [Variovorax sp. KK3]
MAIFKEMRRVRPSSSKAFDRTFGPHMDAAYSGIYRCTGCEREIAVEGGRRFPNHPHPPACPAILWQLIVSVSHNVAECVPAKFRRQA